MSRRKIRTNTGIAWTIFNSMHTYELRKLYFGDVESYTAFAANLLTGTEGRERTDQLASSESCLGFEASLVAFIPLFGTSDRDLLGWVKVWCMVDGFGRMTFNWFYAVLT